jgi:hypothetical protein
MADLTPLPSLLSLVPYDVSQAPPFDGNDNHPLPIVSDTSIGDRTMAVTTAGAVTAGRCNNNRLKACIVAASMPLPSLPSLVPHGITLDEIMLAHAPPLSPVHANDAPGVTLFCGLQGVSQNKRLTLPRAKSFIDCMNSYNNYSQPLIVAQHFMNFLLLSKQIFLKQLDFLLPYMGLIQGMERTSRNTRSSRYSWFY